MEAVSIKVPQSYNENMTMNKATFVYPPPKDKKVAVVIVVLDTKAIALVIVAIIIAVAAALIEVIVVLVVIGIAVVVVVTVAVVAFTQHRKLSRSRKVNQECEEQLNTEHKLAGKMNFCSQATKNSTINLQAKMERLHTCFLTLSSFSKLSCLHLSNALPLL